MAYEDAETYTDAQMLAHVRRTKLAVLNGGQSYTINGKTFQRPSLDSLNRTEAELIAKIAETEAEATGGGIAIVRYGERV